MSTAAVVDGALRVNSIKFYLCRMTGVGGRPEVIIEGSNSRDGDWKAYEFLYKPGDLQRRPPVVGMSILSF